MKSRQEDKLSMALATQQVLKDNTSLWSNIPAMVVEFNNLGTKIAEIEEVRGVQEKNITGVSADKEKTKQQAIETALIVIGALKAFAIMNEDNTLYEKIAYTRAQLKKTRDTILTDRLKIVRDEANANVSALNDYNLTQVEINNLTSAISTYENMIPKPRVALNVRKSATETLDRLFHELNSPLFILDGLVGSLMNVEPELYATYKNARIIAGSSNGGNGVRGTVRDKLTGAPLPDVKISINAPFHKLRINAKKSTRTMRTETNLDGHYEMRRLPAGNYELTMECEGYNKLIVQIKIEEGKIAEGNGSLDRILMSSAA